MAEIIPAVISLLNNNSAVYAAFSNRITASKIPDGQAYPHARIFEVTAPIQYTHGGQSGKITMLQIDVFDDDQTGIDTNTELIRSCLSGYKGQMGSVSAGFVFVTVRSTPWDATSRNFRKILEARIGTND